jgi:hypothetical protein
MQNIPLEDWFAALRQNPSRDPQIAKRGKERFLIQARSMAESVSKSKGRRHIWWIDSINNLIFNKEISPMYMTIASIVLVLSLMFGGTGATVLAAQASLPNQPLYQVKTFSEELALRYSQQDSQRLQMELEYANRRVNEMVAMAEMDLEPPGRVLTRLETHLDQVVALAVKIEEVEMSRVLSQIRNRLQQQIRSLDEAPAAGPLMTRAMEAVQLRLHWVELGLNEPKAFREQSQFRNRFSEPPDLGGGFGSGSNGENGANSYGPGFGTGDGSPGDGPGPHMEGDPPGYSPGPGPNPDRDPGPNSDNDLKPEDSSYQQGPNPNPGQDPENGSDKSGPCADQTCSDPNPGPGRTDDESQPAQDSGGNSGREGGNKP